MVTLYNVVSADGYIARKDGSEDFIPDSCWSQTLAILDQYDCIVLGRKTYETIQDYDQGMRYSFDALSARKVVITRDKKFKAKPDYEISLSPEEVIKPDLNIVVTSGPTLNDYLIQNGLVDAIVQHKIPVNIEQGIKPYGSTGSVKNITVQNPV